MRRPDPEAVHRAQLDLECLEGGLEKIRLRHDSLYRRRKAAYLRGEINWNGVLGGETHEEWFLRFRAEGPGARL